jgi:hypothetical protein
MFTSRSVVVYSPDGVTVRTRDTLSTSGTYKLALQPGSYLIQIQPAGIGEGEKKPFTIKALETTIVDFDIDTGIR